MDSFIVTSLRIAVISETDGSVLFAPPVDGITQMSTPDPSGGTVIVYSGEQPVEVYLEVLRSFQYVNTADEPLPGTNTLLVQVFTLNQTSGGPTASNIAEVTINVVPVNDNNPVFSQSDYTAMVDEAAPRGEPVVTVQASDSDLYGSTRITYEFEGENEDFEINATSGVITTARELNAETIVSYVLIVIASDNDGDSPRSSTVSVLISVADINDNTPVFGLSQYSGSVIENSAGGQTVVTVTATDNDITSTNNDITFEIETNDIGSGSAYLTLLPPQQATPLPFTIDPIAGVIRVAEFAEIDFEAVSEYYLVVVATDSGEPQLTASVEVVVSVQNENDEAPVFSRNMYTGSVADDSAADTSILTVQAFDADSVSITYSVDNSEYLDIDALTGLVTLNRMLDFITTPSLTATVFANDTGSPPRIGQASITIEVVNVNNNPPVFSQSSYTFSVVEGAVLEAAVIAADADQDQLTYSIVEGAGGIFTLDPVTGRLGTSPGALLDYETQSVYLLTAAAMDGLFTSHVDVTLLVEDANDNAPVFTRSQYSATIPETLPVGSSVVQVSAEDSDTGSNADSVYSIRDNGGLFTIGPNTGIITTAVAIDFETSSGPFIVQVVAENTESPFFNTSATVTIIVSDTNDNRPVIYLEQLSYDYFENSPPLPIASGLSITDADSNTYLLTSCDVTLDRGECQLDTSELRDICGDCEYTCGEELGFNDQLNVLDSTVEVYPTGQVFSFIGNLSEMGYQSVLSTLTYVNLAPEPLPGVRTILIQCHDTHLPSNTLNVSIDLVPVNDNPIEIVADTQRLRFQEGDSILLVTGSVSLSDRDTSATVDWMAVSLLGSRDPERESLSITGVGEGQEILVNQTGALAYYQVTSQLMIDFTHCYYFPYCRLCWRV